MQKITNDFILESLSEYVQGNAESSRPFSIDLVDKYGNTISKDQLYTDEENNVHYKLNYEDDQNFYSLCSNLECAVAVVTWYDYVAKNNSPEDITEDEYMTRAEAQGLIDNQASK